MMKTWPRVYGGNYANRDEEYEVLADASVWLIGGSAVPEGVERTAMTEGAMGGPTSGGTTSRSRGPDSRQVHRPLG
jgi:hypothetical protein